MTVTDGPYAVFEEYDLALQVVLKAASKSILVALLESVGAPISRQVEERPHRHEGIAWLAPDQAVSTGHRRAVFVRNPFDRLVSCYAFFRTCKGRREEVSVGFDAWLAKVAANPLADAHYRPMTHDLREPCFIGRFENIAHDWLGFQDWLGVSLLDLDHLNATVRKDYRDMYDDDTRALVERAYAEDLERFDYSF